jgi:hypothetical protein
MTCRCDVCTAPPRPITTPALSRALDRVILQLDACPSPLRRLHLRLHKRWLERRVPAGGVE